MITLKKTVAVKIEFEGKETVFEFTKPRLNKILSDAQEEVSTNPVEAAEKRVKRIMARLESVGEVEEDGKLLTIEDFKNLNVPADFITALVTAYDLAATPKSAVDPKKESATAA